MLFLSIFVGSVPRGSLAQLVEHFTFNEGVDGSNPSRATIFTSPK
jgi:hypothetical protein